MLKASDVLILAAIAPSSDSVRDSQLKYNGLNPAVKKHLAHEKVRQDDFWRSKEGSLEETEAAKRLAKQYMLMTAGRLNDHEDLSPGSKSLWSERYTQATSELFGTPEADLSVELLENSVNELFAEALESSADNELLDHFKEVCESFELNVDRSESKEAVFTGAAEKLGELLNEKYQDVYDALELDDASERIDPEGIADRFEKAISVLAENHDKCWNDWEVTRKEGKDTLSVASSKNQVIVGMDRASVSPEQLKGLFSHEVLLHGQRAVNGSKLSEELSNGLPDYLDAEEGLGVFFEYAITGKIPEKNIDRYVDVSLALGLVDGKPRNRQELLDFAMTRALIRNELKTESKKLSDDDVQKEVYTHVNRIYRGSLGDENIGVFTKDIAYHKGFIEMGKYIEDNLSQGKTIEEIIDYLLKGKFDPNNLKHTEEVELSSGGAS